MLSSRHQVKQLLQVMERKKIWARFFSNKEDESCFEVRGFLRCDGMGLMEICDSFIPGCTFLGLKFRSGVSYVVFLSKILRVIVVPDNVAHT